MIREADKELILMLPKYIGEHKDGKFHGQGTYTYTDGTVERGLWENDELIRE